MTIIERIKTQFMEVKENMIFKLDEVNLTNRCFLYMKMESECMIFGLRFTEKTTCLKAYGCGRIDTTEPHVISFFLSNVQDISEHSL